MIYQPNNWNMLQMLENLSAQAIYYWPRADSRTGILNTDQTCDPWCEHSVIPEEIWIKHISTENL